MLSNYKNDGKIQINFHHKSAEKYTDEKLFAIVNTERKRAVEKNSPTSSPEYTNFMDKRRMKQIGRGHLNNIMIDPQAR
jgi:hypothetical protein